MTNIKIEKNMKYTYKQMIKDINRLAKKYNFLEIGTIGKTELNKEIPFIKIGKGSKKILYSASFHANEWITSLLLMLFLEEYADKVEKNKNIIDKLAKEIYEQVSLYIIPMVNPDGVELVTGSLENVDNIYEKTQNIAKQYSNIDFPNGWKANIKGIDLNLQFPAGWEKAKEIKYKQGYIKPAPRDYVGEKPLEAKEARALYEFTKEKIFDLIIAYHTQGKEIYWEYQGECPLYAEKIGKKFSEVSGYELMKVPYNSSFAGYKDWFIHEFDKPGFTIEAGIGENPLPIEQISEIYIDNYKILELGLILLLCFET